MAWADEKEHVCDISVSLLITSPKYSLNFDVVCAAKIINLVTCRDATRGGGVRVVSCPSEMFKRG